MMKVDGQLTFLEQEYAGESLRRFGTWVELPSIRSTGPALRRLRAADPAVEADDEEVLRRPAERGFAGADSADRMSCPYAASVGSSGTTELICVSWDFSDKGNRKRKVRVDGNFSARSPRRRSTASQAVQCMALGGFTGCRLQDWRRPRAAAR
jgi:hypothetical protein